MLSFTYFRNSVINRDTVWRYIIKAIDRVDKQIGTKYQKKCRQVSAALIEQKRTFDFAYFILVSRSH
jgi:hypothetical protein